MKKINIFVFTIIIFFMPSIQGMEETTTKHNEQFTLIQLPKEIHYDICNHLLKKNNQTNNLYNLIKSTLALRTTCTYFYNFLTKEQISQICGLYPQEIKDETLKVIVTKTNDKTYEKLRFPSLILLYAKANPYVTCYSSGCSLLAKALLYANESFITTLLQHEINPNTFVGIIPPLFHAKTTKCAQLLIDNGANIQIKRTDNETNILWHLIKPFSPEETSLDLFQFYLDKGVNPKILHNTTNASLFHELASSCGYSNVLPNDCYTEKNWLKLGKILVKKIPTMINALNTFNQTPLDVAMLYSNMNHMKHCMQFFLDNNAKTAQKLNENMSKK